MTDATLLYAASMVFGAFVIAISLALASGRIVQKVEALGTQLRGISSTVHRHSIQLARVEVKLKLPPPSQADDEEEAEG